LKKIISLLLVASFLGTSASAALFTDIRTHWASEYINTLTQKGIVNGVTQTKFAPEGTVTKSEYLKMIMNVVGIGTVPYRKGECLELGGGEWYCQYLQSALDKGLIPKEMVAGYDVDVRTTSTGETKAVYYGSFNGGMPITRQEMAVLTQNMYQYQQNARTMQTNTEPKKLEFGDVASIDDWALSAVEIAVAQGFIFGMDSGNFEPNSTATRAQAAAIIFRVLGKVESWNV